MFWRDSPFFFFCTRVSSSALKVSLWFVFIFTNMFQIWTTHQKIISPHLGKYPGQTEFTFCKLHAQVVLKSHISSVCTQDKEDAVALTSSLEIKLYPCTWYHTAQILCKSFSPNLWPGLLIFSLQPIGPWIHFARWLLREQLSSLDQKSWPSPNSKTNHSSLLCPFAIPT